MTSGDENLVVIGRPLVLQTMRRWLPGEGIALLELLRSLAYDDEILPEFRPLLVELAMNADALGTVRRQALKTLAAKGEPGDANSLRPLLAEEQLAAAAVATIYQLDHQALDAITLVASSSREVRQATAVACAAELATSAMDSLLSVWLDADGAVEQVPLWRALAEVADPRFVPSVIARCAQPELAHDCWNWLRGQAITNEQVAVLAERPNESPAAARWLVNIVRAQGRIIQLDPGRIASLPDENVKPTEDTASLVGYLGLSRRAPWLRNHLATADKRTTAGITIALGMLGAEDDIPVLAQLGTQISWLQTDAWMSRLLLGDSPSLIEDTTPKSLFALWAMERLFERWPVANHRALHDAVERSRDRGLHNEDLVEFRSVAARLRQRFPAEA